MHILLAVSRNKMSKIPVKNHRKNPQGILKEAETNSRDITGK